MIERMDKKTLGRRSSSTSKIEYLSKEKKEKNDRHEGFARGHPPYYWPRLSGLNFLDLTG
jgi:hypothetical protein